MNTNDKRVLFAPTEIRIWLDDLLDDPDSPERHVPEGWVGAKTAPEAIRLLEIFKVVEISFDHDLGEEPGVGTGADVARWIEEAAYNGVIGRLGWKVHSANPVGRENITSAMRSAERFWARNES